MEHTFINNKITGNLLDYAIETRLFEQMHTTSDRNILANRLYAELCVFGYENCLLNGIWREKTKNGDQKFMLVKDMHIDHIKRQLENNKQNRLITDTLKKEVNARQQYADEVLADIEKLKVKQYNLEQKTKNNNMKETETDPKKDTKIDTEKLNPGDKITIIDNRKIKKAEIVKVNRQFIIHIEGDTKNKKMQEYKLKLATNPDKISALEKKLEKKSSNTNQKRIIDQLFFEGETHRHFKILKHYDRYHTAKTGGGETGQIKNGNSYDVEEKLGGGVTRTVSMTQTKLSKKLGKAYMRNIYNKLLKKEDTSGSAPDDQKNEYVSIVKFDSKINELKGFLEDTIKSEMKSLLPTVVKSVINELGNESANKTPIAPTSS